MTTKELAEYLGKPESTVRAACKRAGVKKHGRDYMLDRRDVARVRSQIHDAPGRPRGGKR